MIAGVKAIDPVFGLMYLESSQRFSKMLWKIEINPIIQDCHHKCDFYQDMVPNVQNTQKIL